MGGQLCGNGDALFCRLAQDAADAGVGVLDKRTRVSVEVDALLRIEEHVLACVHLEDEILESAHTHDAGNLGGLLFRDALQFVHLVGAHLACVGHHCFYQVVGIHHGAFAALHLAVGQFHHAVGEMDKVLSPFESQFVEQDTQHLEMVVLFVAHHIDHFVDGEILETQFGGADVLCHVYRCPVAAQQ